MFKILQKSRSWKIAACFSKLSESKKIELLLEETGPVKSKDPIQKTAPKSFPNELTSASSDL